MLRVNDELVLALEISEFRELKNPLIPQKTDLEQKLTALETGNVSRFEPLKQWVLRANQAEKWVSDDNWVEMKSFLQNVGSNRLLRAETLTVSFRIPWNLLAETTVAVRSTNDVSQTCIPAVILRGFAQFQFQYFCTWKLRHPVSGCAK